MANDKRYIDQNRHIIGGNIMKLRKRIAALGAAMVMAVSMMSIGASADSWHLNSNPSGPSSESVFNQTKYFFPSGGKIYGVNESCTYYYSSSGNGNVGYAEYWGHCQDLYGQNQIIGHFNDYYHYGTQSTHRIDLSSPVPSGYKLLVKYRLRNTNVYSNMNGYVNPSYTK